MAIGPNQHPMQHPPPPTREEADWILLTILTIIGSPLVIMAAVLAAFWTGFSPDGHVWTSHDYFVVFPSLFVRGLFAFTVKFWPLTIPWTIAFVVVASRCYRHVKGPTRRQSQHGQPSRRVR